MAIYGRTAAAEAEMRLSANGLDQDAVTLVVEQVVPVSYAELVGIDTWYKLVGMAGEYLIRTGAHRFQNPKVDITLVTPIFDDTDLTGQYNQATTVARDAENAVTARIAASGGQPGTRPTAAEVHDRAREWLRVVHRTMIGWDLFKLGPIPRLLPPEHLELYLLGELALLDVEPSPAQGEVEWATFQLSKACTEPAGDQGTLTSPASSPQELLSHSLDIDLFGLLFDLLKGLESDLRAAVGLASDLRRSHQLVSLTTMIVRHLLSFREGRSFSLLIELEAPPPVGERMMAEYPMIGDKTLAALRHTVPATFGSIGRPSEISDAQLRRSWERMTLGNRGSGFASENGVLGLLAKAASPAIEQLLHQAAGPQP